MDDLLQDFIAEATRDLAVADAQLATMSTGAADPDALAGVFRIFHSVKGTSGFVGLEALGALAHEVENLLGELREGDAPPECLAATLALTEQCRAALRAAERPERAAPRARRCGVLEAALRGLPPLVEKLAGGLGKRIGLELAGEDVVLDRRSFRVVRTALVHLVRNAADHGIEAPAERRKLGKPEMGTIRVSARAEGERIEIVVSDDGRGLATGAIAAAAVGRGLATKADIARLSPAQIQRFAFAPGLSTAALPTHVSGRGIGMDVVQAAMDLLGGAVEVESRDRHGTTFTLVFPRAGTAGLRRARNTAAGRKS